MSAIRDTIIALNSIPQNFRDLLAVSDLILRVQAARFDMRVFGETPNQKHPCGTAHCMAGWAADQGIAGLELHWNFPGARAVLWCQDHFTDAENRNLSSFKIAARAFDIEIFEAEILFGTNNESAQANSNRLRRFVEDKVPGAVQIWVKSCAMG